MKRRLLYFLVAPLAMVAIIGGWNYFAVQRHLSETIAGDPRNIGIEALAHYQWFINPQTLVFDLRNVSGEKSPLDVSRTLLQFADKMKSRTFERVVLSYKGSPRLILQGDYFQLIGTEYELQNPVYTLRTLPENVYNLDGTPAFGTWTGGWLGVVGKQMENLNEFHRRWYLSDMASGR